MQDAVQVSPSGKDPVEVTIEGQRYAIRSNLDQEEVQNLAYYVDRVMQDIRKFTKTSDPNRVAILAALNIAEDLFRVRGRSTEAARRAKDLIELIDEKCNS